MLYLKDINNIIIEMKYFTSKAYEKVLDEKYMQQIKAKQLEIDEKYRKTKKIQKYTAYAYISKLERVFCVEDDKIYCGEVKEENECPTQEVSGGKTYILDSDFELQINNFKQKHKRYRVIFYLNGKYGPSCYYCSKIGALPAKMESYDGDILIVENEDKYDLCVG
jgi:hypothetical protein